MVTVVDLCPLENGGQRLLFFSFFPRVLDDGAFIFYFYFLSRQVGCREVSLFCWMPSTFETRVRLEQFAPKSIVARARELISLRFRTPVPFRAVSYTHLTLPTIYSV